MKNTTKNMKSEVFDNTKSYEFKVNIFLGPGKSETIDFTLNSSDINGGNLTYDHVYFAALNMMDSKYPIDYYPKSDLEGFIFIKDEDGEWSPVVSESDTDNIKMLRKWKKYNRFLVLPDALYVLTPEFLLYTSLVDNGMIDKKKIEFDYDKFHEILQSLEKNTDFKIKKRTKCLDKA